MICSTLAVMSLSHSLILFRCPPQGSLDIHTQVIHSSVRRFCVFRFSQAFSTSYQHNVPIIVHESAPSTKTRTPRQHLTIYAYLQSKTERVECFLSSPHSDEFELELTSSSPHSDADSIHHWYGNPSHSPSSCIASRTALCANRTSTCSACLGLSGPRGVSGFGSSSKGQPGRTDPSHGFPSLRVSIVERKASEPGCAGGSSI